MAVPNWRGVLRDPILHSLLIGMAVFLVVWETRQLGGLEWLELLLYDQGLTVVHHVVPRKVSAHVVLVGATESDINHLGWPLSDHQLAESLQHILDLKPRVIGVDIFRDRPRLEGIDELRRVLVEHDNIILATQIPYGQEPAIPPPPFLQGTQQAGIVNLPVDSDGKVRRSILYFTKDNQPADSLSFLLALRFLSSIGITPTPSLLGLSYMQLGASNIRPLQANDGGYHDIETNGFQFLLDFKEASNPLPFYSLGDALENKIPRNALEGKVVLLGIMARSSKDQVDAPLRFAPDQPLFGIEWHAFATNQLIRQAMVDDGPMQVLPDWLTEIWILFWCLVAGIVARMRRFPWSFAGLGLFLMACLALLGLVLDWWLLLGSPLFGFFLSTALSMALRRYREKKELRIMLQEWQQMELEKKVLDAMADQLVGEKKHLKEDAEVANTIAYSLLLMGEGQLDKAWENLQSCPMGPKLIPPFYRLGLEFEKTGKKEEARTVFQWISQYDPKFKDVADRLMAGNQMATAIRNLSLAIKNADNDPTLLPSLDRYRLEREVGRGAMGIIYQAQDTRIKRQVAIKVLSLRQDFCSEDAEEARVRFNREIERMGSLQHCDIVHILDAGHEPDGDIVWFAMEFIVGHDLKYYANKRNMLTLRAVLYIVGRIALALDHCQQKRVVHRDVKPANIMVSQDFRIIKLSDFGIARQVEGHQTQLTKLGGIIGTPEYMSPEQFSGSKIDYRSDIYSLGATLFHLVTGQKPFSGGIEVIMNKIINHPHPDPRTLNPNLPLCLKDVIDRAMAKNPDKRYQRGEDMAKALRECMAIVQRG